MRRVILATLVGGMVAIASGQALAEESPLMQTARKYCPLMVQTKVYASLEACLKWHAAMDNKPVMSEKQQAEIRRQQFEQRINALQSEEQLLRLRWGRYERCVRLEKSNCHRR